MRNPAEELEGTAFSYIRFSSKKQERGDSIRRQTELRDLWLARHPRVTLDDTLRMSDLGVSSFRGKNRTDAKSALAAFMRAVESGHVRAGSILCLEALDRLTREDEIQATHTLTGLLLAGIRVVTLAPEQVFDRQSDQLELMRAVMELGRGHGESLRKSSLLSAAWKEKKREAVENGKAHGRGCPQWLQLVGGVGGKYQFKPGARELIRRIHDMAQGGMGARLIAARLNDEGVTNFTGGIWNAFYVRKLLAGREVMGEYQPHKRDGEQRVKEGGAVANYFPAAVDESTWLLTQQSLKGRSKRGGRPANCPEHINVFQSLLHDARTGGSLICIVKSGTRVYMPGSVSNGKGGPTFPVAVLERGILGELAELDPRDVFGRDAGSDEVAMLTAHVARLDGQLKAMADQFDDDEIPEIAAKVRKKNEERKATVELLDKAKAKAASPLSAAMGDVRGLVAALDRAKGEAERDLRVRIRQALARLVDPQHGGGVHCVFTGPKHIRLAAVQVTFTGGKSSRSYIVVKHQAHGPSKRPERVEILSFAKAGVPPLDLRKPADVTKVEHVLRALAVKMG
jgi:DNA invertase Pin-like site-specific DNA recombinase